MIIGIIDIIVSIEILSISASSNHAAVSSQFLIILLLPDHHHVKSKVPVLEDGVKRKLFVDGTASNGLASHSERADVDTDAYLVKMHKFNQTNELFGDACRTACVFISLAFLHRFLMVSHTKQKQFLVDWIQDNFARSVMAVLLEGSQCAECYIRVVVPAHQAAWGRQHADAFTLPDELEHELFNGSLASLPHACYDGIKDFFSAIDMSQLAVGGAENKSGAKNTLKTVVTTMWEDLKSKPGKPCGYMLVCQGKASTVLACGHPQCYCLYWDSHVYRPNKPEYSASLLFNSEKALLAHMCSEDLYQEEASCHLYAFQQSDVDMQVCGTGNSNPTTPCPLCTEHASSLPDWSIFKLPVNMGGDETNITNPGNPAPASPTCSVHASPVHGALTTDSTGMMELDELEMLDELPASPPSPVPVYGVGAIADRKELKAAVQPASPTCSVPSVISVPSVPATADGKELKAAVQPASPTCSVPSVISVPSVPATADGKELKAGVQPASPTCSVPVQGVGTAVDGKELNAAVQTTGPLVPASPSTNLATPVKTSGWQKLKAYASPLQTPEKIEKGMIDKKRALAECGESASVCTKRSRKSMDKLDKEFAKERRKLIIKGKAMASQLGIDFQGKYQPAHNYNIVKGHWETFQIRLAEGKVSPSDLNCEKCSLIMEGVAGAYNNLVSHSQEGDDEDIPKPLTAGRLSFAQCLEHLKEEEGMVGLRRGRKSHKTHELQTDAAPLWQDLHRWLHLRRPGQYTILGSGKSDLHCNLCNVKFSAFRTNNIHFVLQHEANDLHQAHMSPVMKAHKCKGVPLDGQSCALICWEFRQSFQIWLDHGCPWHLASQQCQHECYFDGVPVIKARTCKGDAFMPVNDSRSCGSCLDLASKRDFCEKVATWHYRIDLSNLVLATALNDRMEQGRLLASMASSPYIGQSQVIIDVPALKEATYLQRRTLLRKQVLCLSRQCMNEAARQFVNNRLGCLPNVSQGQSMSHAIVSHADALVASRTEKIEKNDVDLCKLILQGVLQADDVCRTLVSALVRKADRLKRGCRRVGASHLPGIDDASLHEVGFAIASSLGQSDLLQLFGLNPRGMPKAWAGGPCICTIVQLYNILISFHIFIFSL